MAGDGSSAGGSSSSGDGEDRGGDWDANRGSGEEIRVDEDRDGPTPDSREPRPTGGSDGGADDGLTQVSKAERVAMAVSVGFTLMLFGVALWYAFTGPGVVDPTVGVEGSHQAPGGDVVYTVELRSPGDVGLVRATVSAGCTDPPTELTFENVPATSRRTGTVVCPAGTTDPSVSVSAWIPE